MINISLPSSAEEARKINSKFYFTGKPCKNGHLSPKYTSGQNCIKCNKIATGIQVKNNYFKSYIKNNQEKVKQQRKKHYKKNKNKILKRNNDYYSSNKEKIDKYRLNRKNKLYKENILFRINSCISSQIYHSLKKNKNYIHWEELVDFSLEELKFHLEKQFTKDMTWDNYGSYWHVDHIKPKSLCKTFQEAWILKNLQPLQKVLNLKKGNRYTG